MTDDILDAESVRYPAADIPPAEFERFVAGLLGSARPFAEEFRVQLHEKVRGTDGDYDIDATVRYELAGMKFLVLVECKRHKNPIKRELVQVLHQKVLSSGAHKGLMVSTAPFQSGAVEFARQHGIALAVVTEGRFVFETKSFGTRPEMSREQARQRFGLPDFVAYMFVPDDALGALREDDGESFARFALGMPKDTP